MPSPEALGLAHRIEELGRQVGKHRDADADDVPLPGEIDAATARLDDLRTRLVELERTQPESGGPEADIAELEQAHAEVLEANEGLDARFGRAKAQARLDEARAAERAVLDRLGFASYIDFMTGGRAALSASSVSDELRSLRFEARQAEIELRDLLRAVDRDIARGELVEDLHSVQHQARQLLGDDRLDGRELLDALLDLRVPSNDTTPVQELRTALTAVGLSIHGLDLTTDDVAAMASDWLDEYHRAEDRRARLLAELRDLEARRRDGAQTSAPVDRGTEPRLRDGNRHRHP